MCAKSVINKEPIFLIGKAQKDFWDWYISKEVLKDHKLSSQHRFSNDNVIKIGFLAESDTAQYALITEWLDSVKIFITTKPSIIAGLSAKWEFLIEDNVKKSLLFSSRKKALSKAIEIANRIYNEQNIK